MAKTLIRNGRIVTAVDDYTADILVVDGRIETIGRNLAVGGDVEVHDAAACWCCPAASTCTPTWTGSSVRRIHGRHLRHRHQVGRLRRHHHADRLLQPDRRAEPAGRAGGLAQAPRERLRGRRRAHDHARREPAEPGRHEDADRPRGRDQLQAVHGLPRRADGRRRCAVQGHARGRRQRRDDLHPRRERPGDPGAGPGSGGAGPARAQVPRHHAPVDPRRRGDPSRHPPGRAGRRRRCTSCTCRRARRCRRSPKRATAASRSTPRPARTTCSSPPRSTSGPASRAPST